jgi:hypothetical protein
MKKSTKGSKSTKKSATRKPAAKKPAAKPAAKAVTPSEARTTARARYTPPPLQADGWGPFRYPPR